MESNRIGSLSWVIAEAVVYMRPGGETVEPGLALFAAARHLERIADHATNIAEDIIYLAEGEIVRHQGNAVIHAEGGR